MRASGAAPPQPLLVGSASVATSTARTATPRSDVVIIGSPSRSLPKSHPFIELVGLSERVGLLRIGRRPYDATNDVERAIASVRELARRHA